MSVEKCAAIDCERDREARLWCKKHWRTWRVHGDPNYKRESKPPPRCNIDDCYEVRHAHGLCSAHLYRMQKYGNPFHQGPGQHSGRKTTDNPGYACVHKRLARSRGKASEFDCVSCNGNAHEWAYAGGCPNEQVQEIRGICVRFSSDHSYYVPMCRKCHRAMDDSGLRLINEDGTYRCTAPEYVKPEPTMTPHRRRSPKRH